MLKRKIRKLPMLSGILQPFIAICSKSSAQLTSSTKPVKENIYNTCTRQHTFVRKSQLDLVEINTWIDFSYIWISQVQDRRVRVNRSPATSHNVDAAPRYLGKVNIFIPLEMRKVCNEHGEYGGGTVTLQLCFILFLESSRKGTVPVKSLTKPWVKAMASWS